MKKYFLLALMFPIFLVNKIFAQLATDSTLAKSFEKAVGISSDFIRDNSALYNGSEYTSYDKRIRDNPYFFSDKMEEGSVFYDGNFYQHVYLLYDIVSDDVIINRYNQYLPIRLVKQKIEYFRLPGHFFLRIVQDSSNSGLISTGFYEQLYSGKTAVLAKRNKSMEVSIDPNTPPRFVQTENYFIKMNAVYYAAGNKNAVMRLFKDKKKAVLKWLRQNNIRFKKNYEYALTKAAAYYDQLN